MKTESLLRPHIESCGLLELSTIKDLLRDLADHGCHGDQALINVLYAVQAELGLRTERTVFPEYEATFRRDCYEDFRRQWCNASACLDIVLHIAKHYIESVNSHPFDGMSSLQHYAMETIVWRVYDGFVSIRALSKIGQWADMVVIMRACTEALLVFGKASVDPAFLEALVRGNLAEEIQRLSDWREVNRERFDHAVPGQDEAIEAHIAEIKALGVTVSRDENAIYTFAGEGVNNKGKIGAPRGWKGLVFDEISTEVYGPEDAWRAFEVFFGDGNAFAHTLYTRWSAWIRRTESGLKCAATIHEHESPIPFEAFELMILYARALERMRPQMVAHYSEFVIALAVGASGSGGPDVSIP